MSVIYYVSRDVLTDPLCRFADFFDTPAQNSAAPQALGFRGFFRGAYSYHFHNFWYVIRFPYWTPKLRYL